MPDETETTPSASAAAAPVATSATYVQLVAVNAPSERQAAVALETPDANGRVPVIARIGGAGAVRWEPIAVAIGLVLFNLIVNPPVVFWIGLLVLAILMVVLALIGRLFIRVPEGAWALVSRQLRYERTLTPGVYTVPPWLTPTHLVSRREIVFDAPVTAAPSSDGVRIDVDVLVALRVLDPAKFVYSVSVSDFDQYAQAAIQDTVRSLVRATPALEAFDFGADQATKLRAALGKMTGPYGVEVSAATFTRVTLPDEMSASLEARNLATVQLAEEAEQFTLEQKRLTDRAALETLQQAERMGSIEKEAAAEELRLKHMEARLKAHPAAARYDLQLERLRVARDLAGNTRAVVGFGGSGELTTAALLAGDGSAPTDAEVTDVPAPPARRPAGATRARKPG